jgi:hypothetical protein
MAIQEVTASHYMNEGRTLWNLNDSELDTRVSVIEAIVNSPVIQLGSTPNLELSYDNTNDALIIESLTNSKSSGDILRAIVNDEEIFGITYQGVLRLNTLGSAPTAITGGIYVDSSGDFWLGS